MHAYVVFVHWRRPVVECAAYRQPNQNRETSDYQAKWSQLAASFIVICIGAKQNVYFSTPLVAKMQRVVHEKESESLFFACR